MNMRAFHFGKMTETGRSVITPYERDLIDEAIRAGMTKRIKANTTGLPEYRWDGRQNQLVMINGPTAQQVRDRAIKAASAARRLKSADRFGEIMDLVKQGKTLAEIADQQGTTRGTVKDIIKRGRERLRAEGVDVKTRSDATADRRANISALLKSGKTTTQIAEIRGESVAAVRSAIKLMRKAQSGARK